MIIPFCANDNDSCRKQKKYNNNKNCQNNLANNHVLIFSAFGFLSLLLVSTRMDFTELFTCKKFIIWFTSTVKIDRKRNGLKYGSQYHCHTQWRYLWFMPSYSRISEKQRTSRRFQGKNRNLCAVFKIIKSFERFLLTDGCIFLCRCCT